MPVRWALWMAAAVAALGVTVASPAHASREKSPALARKASSARWDEPALRQQEEAPAGLPVLGASKEDLQEKLIELLPAPALEDVARTLVDRTVRLDISSRKAMVVVRLPIG